MLKLLDIAVLVAGLLSQLPPFEHRPVCLRHVDTALAPLTKRLIASRNFALKWFLTRMSEVVLD